MLKHPIEENGNYFQCFDNPRPCGTHYIHLQEPLMRPGQGRNTTVRIIKRARKPLLIKVQH